MTLIQSPNAFDSYLFQSMQNEDDFTASATVPICPYHTMNLLDLSFVIFDAIIMAVADVVSGRWTHDITSDFLISR